MFSRSSADRSASFIFLHDEDMEDSGLGESQLHASFDAFGRTVSFSPSEDTADEEERFESLLTGLAQLANDVPTPSNMSAISKIEPFSGQDSSRWIASATLILEANGVAKEKAVATAVTHFRGPMLDWWASLSKEDKADLANWDTFAKAVIGHCCGTNHVRRSEAELAKLRCGLDFFSFDAEFTRLTIAIPDMSPAEKKRAFRAGLSGTNFEQPLLVLPDDATLPTMRDRVAQFAAGQQRPTVAAISPSGESWEAIESRLNALEKSRDGNNNNRWDNNRNRDRGRDRDRDRGRDGDLRAKMIAKGICTKCFRPWTKNPSCCSCVSGACLASSSSSALFFLEGSLSGKSIRFLLDSGASHCFLNSRVADRLGLKCSSAGISVTFADSSSKPCRGRTVAHVCVDSSDIEVEFLVADIGFDAILGLSWLDIAQPQVQWQAPDLFSYPVKASGFTSTCPCPLCAPLCN